jgi:hypothetical protein
MASIQSALEIDIVTSVIGLPHGSLKLVESIAISFTKTFARVSLHQ